MTAETSPAPVDVAGYASALAAGIEAALPGWVERSVARIWDAWIATAGAGAGGAAAGAANTAGAAGTAGAVPPGVAAAAVSAGRRAAAEVGPPVRALLAADIDDQRTTPLAILRQDAVAYPTGVLIGAGVPGVVRDRAAEELFPHDLYDLVPASYADLDPELADVGLCWGAAKAFEHKRRHGGSR